MTQINSQKPIEVQVNLKAVKKGKYNEIKAYLQEQGVNDDQLSQLDRFLPFKEKDKTIYTNISTVRIGKFQVKKSVDENYFEVFSDDADSVSKLLTALNEHVKSEKDQAEFLFEKDQAEFLDEQIKNRASYACIKDKKNNDYIVQINPSTNSTDAVSLKIVKSGVNLDEAILLAEQNFEQVKRAYQTDSNFRKSWDDFVKYRKHSFARPLIEKMSSIDEMFSAIPQFFDLISAATDAEIEKKSIAYGITNKFSTVEIGNLTSYLPTAYLFKKYDDIKNFLRKDPSFCCMRCSNLWTG